MVKAAKKAVYVVLGNSEVTDEELITACTGVESHLNSRPLTYQSADPRDNVPLTPNHFLHGQAGGNFAPENVDTTPFNPRKRWRKVQALISHVWSSLDEGVPTVVKSKAEVESDCKWFKEWGCCVGPRSRYTSRKMATRKNS